MVPALAARARCVQAHCVRWWAPADEVLPRRRPGAGGAGRADAPAAPRQAQKTTRLCIARDLTEADVVARIMRKENYLIGLLNRGVLALHVPVPGLRKRLMLTKTLEWNLQWCARPRAPRTQPALQRHHSARRHNACRDRQRAARQALCVSTTLARWTPDVCPRRTDVCRAGVGRPSGARGAAAQVRAGRDAGREELPHPRGVRGRRGRPAAALPARPRPPASSAAARRIGWIQARHERLHAGARAASLRRRPGCAARRRRLHAEGTRLPAQRA